MNKKKVNKNDVCHCPKCGRVMTMKQLLEQLRNTGYPEKTIKVVETKLAVTA